MSSIVRDDPLARNPIDMPPSRLTWRCHGYRVVERAYCTGWCGDAGTDCRDAEHLAWVATIERRDGEDAMGQERWVHADALPTDAVADLLAWARTARTAPTCGHERGLVYMGEELLCGPCARARLRAAATTETAAS